MKIRILKTLSIKGLTITDLSQKTNIDYKTLHNIVNMKTKGAKFVTLDKIAKALDVSIDELFDRKDHSDEGSH